MIYLITYDLRMPGREYSPLYDAIKNYNDWQHPLESVWFIHTDQNANDIYSQLRGKIDTHDRLLVIRVDNDDKQGWLAKTFWLWLNNKQ